MPPLVLLVLIVFVDLLGFTLVMPLLPRFAQHYGFDPTRIGLLLAAYPMAQLVAGPVLGRLSDRFGRRPVLVASQAGTALSFVILGLSRNYSVMLLARLLDGASGGNILVAQAYMADVTRPEDRARGMGLIGAAFGVGFVAGPLLGAGLLLLPLGEDLRLRLPFLVAAGFSTIAFGIVLTRLPESLPADATARRAARVLSWRGVVDTLTYPAAGLLVLVATLTTLAFATLEGTFSLYLEQRMDWDAVRAALGFALVGLVAAIVQGGLIRPLVRRFGEPRLILAGTATLAAGLAGLALVQNVWELVAASAAVALGSGLAGPATQGLLSRVTPESEQGAVFGTLVSAQTLARMVNYVAANRLLGHSGPSAPYWEGAALGAGAFLLAATVVGPRLRHAGHGMGAGVAADTDLISSEKP
jgi:DHA1 family tetracycline resistance protein-like MFS transporter